MMYMPSKSKQLTSVTKPVNQTIDMMAMYPFIWSQTGAHSNLIGKDFCVRKSKDHVYLVGKLCWQQYTNRRVSEFLEKSNNDKIKLIFSNGLNIYYAEKGTNEKKKKKDNGSRNNKYDNEVNKCKEIIDVINEGSLLIAEHTVEIPCHPTLLLENTPLPYKQSFEIVHDDNEYAIFIFQLPR